MFSSETLTDTTVKKRGRKTTNVNYFDVAEEAAVRRYLTAETFEEKNAIYNEFLRGPLDKMISSIIRRYKFKPSKEKKAYSYFGTICKNYLMGQIIKDQKDTNRKISYEDISSSLEQRPDMVYYMELEKTEADDVIQGFLNELRNYVDNEPLTDNEKKLGIALLELFENYKTIFLGTDNNKFNKNIILLSIREMTNLSTKEIRTAMKRFKKLYYVVLNNIIE
jgi:hypothetical protein